MNMTITSASGIRTVAIEPGMPLSDILHREDPSFAMPCAGNHKMCIRDRGGNAACDS